MSYTGVLKNVIEWLSRPSFGAKLAGKPVALVGASAIKVGVSQSHLRDVMAALNMNIVNRPITQVDNAREKFDKEGNLINNGVMALLGQLKEELIT
jgi:chromate reductase, NAD(P)H dehydrogenase (quinone)